MSKPRPTEVVPIGMPQPPPRQLSKGWTKAGKRTGALETDMQKLARKAHTHTKVRSGAWIDDLEHQDGDSKITRAKTSALRSMRIKGARRHDVMGMSVMGYGKPVYDPFAAAHLPLVVQLGFRRKMLGTLAMQLFATLILTLIILFGLRDQVVFPLTGWIPDPVNASKTRIDQYNGTSTTALMITAVVWAILLCIMFCFKHWYPANYVLLTFFTLFEAVTCALWSAFFSSTDDITLFGFFPRILTFATIHTPLTMFWATRIQYISELPSDAHILPDGEVKYTDEYKPKEHFKDETTGRYVKVMSFANASFRAWWMTGMIIFPLYFTVLKGNNENEHIIFSMLVSILLATWVSYDAQCLSLKMSPDEFMSAVVFFYTDLILLLLISVVLMAFIALMCCGGGGDSGDSGSGGGGGEQFAGGGGEIGDVGGGEIGDVGGGEALNGDFADAGETKTF